MQDPNTKAPHTAHTTTEVPAVLVGLKGVSLKNGALSDIAPTLLRLLDMDQPVAMTGGSLLRSTSAEG